jgi:hypothetical protein
MSSSIALTFICETRTLNDPMASRTKKESAEELAKPFEDRLHDEWGMPHLAKVDHERLQELRRQLPVPRQRELDCLRKRLNQRNIEFV